MAKSLGHMRGLGYWLNPFSTLTDEQWLEIGFLHPKLETALASGRDLLLLGDQGAGKTTALRLMSDHFIDAGLELVYEHLPEGAHRFVSELNAVEVFVLDEAQRLSWWQRRRLAQVGQTRRLIVSSHADVSRWLDQPLVFDVNEFHDVEHWQQMITARLTYFALPDVARAGLSAEAVMELHGRFAPNFRAAEFFLYEVWERLEGVKIVDMRDVSCEF